MVWLEGLRARHALPVPCAKWSALAGLLFAVSSWAVVPGVPPADPAWRRPADQEWLREQERERARQTQLQPPELDVRLPPAGDGSQARLPDAETPCFPVRRLTLDGDSARAFRWALAAANPDDDPAIGRCLGAVGVGQVIRRIQEAIMQRGFVTTRVLAAPQDLSGGVLTLTVLPGRVRALRFAPGSSPRATRWNAVPVRPGDLLNVRDIEQGLENFKRVPTVEADIRIEPAAEAGAAPGDSDLVMNWQQRFPLRLSLSADDAGSKSTGKYQGSATVSYDHWWTLNDLFYASFHHDLGGGEPGRRGTRGHTLHYQIPYHFWLLGFTGSSHAYHQAVAGSGSGGISVYHGNSHNGDIRLSWLAHRDAHSRTGTYLRGWVRDTRNYVDHVAIGVQRRRMAGWEAGLTHRVFFGHAVLDASAGYRRGTGAMGAMPAPEQAAGEGSSRSAILGTEARLALPFRLGPLALRYGLDGRAQWSRAPLVLQDRFAIGGRHTVRGFDGELLLTGERGWLLRNDLGVFLGLSGQELYFGLDHGQVGGPSQRRQAGDRLTGAVAGVRGSVRGLSYDVFAGRPLRKPDGFRTAKSTAGFMLHLSY